jgi:hypothetical protein
LKEDEQTGERATCSASIARTSEWGHNVDQGHVQVLASMNRNAIGSQSEFHGARQTCCDKRAFHEILRAPQAGAVPAVSGVRMKTLQQRPEQHLACAAIRAAAPQPSYCRTMPANFSCNIGGTESQMLIRSKFTPASSVHTGI